MEYVDGETLAQILTGIKDAEPETETPFGSKDEIAYFGNLAKAFADVADGLQHAHSKGVIHRDIKPSNLILDGEGRLRILDFGLAHLEGQESLTVSGDVLGTPMYMSPEQARRRKIPIDHRTDIYSLGATMYEALCARPPFRGKDHADTLSQIIEREPVEPRKVNPRLPKDLGTIVLKCLRKDSGDRYGTAEALAQDLRRFARGDMVEARPASRLQAVLRRFRRHRTGLAVTALCATVLLLATVLLGLFWQQRVVDRHKRYDRLLAEGLAGLEIGFASVPGEPGEGERLSLGLVDPDRLRGWFGLSLHRRSSHQEALERLEEAVRVLPDRPEAWLHLSRGRLAFVQERAAESALDRSLQSSPHFVPALIHKAHQKTLDTQPAATPLFFERLLARVDAPWKRLLIRSHLAALESDWETMERLCGELLELSRESEPYRGCVFEHLLRRGRIRSRLDRHLAALEDFLEARRLAPDVITTSLLVAAQYYRLNAPVEAHRTLEETLARFGGPDAALSITDVCLQHGDQEYALSLVASLEDFTRRRMEARFLRQIGRFEDAVKAGREALAAGIREPEIWAEVGHGLIELQRIDDAEEVLRHGLKEFPDDAGLIRLSNVRVAYYRGRLEECLERERTKPETQSTLINSAWCYYRLGQTERALSSLESAIAKDPRDSGVYHERAFMRSRTEDYEGAVSDAVESLVLSRGWHSRSLRRLREIHSPSTNQWFAPHWDRLDQAFQDADARGLVDPSLLGFRALVCLFREQSEPAEALELAQRAVSASSAADSAESLSRLAAVHFARGELIDAVRAIERGLTFRGCRRSLSEQLTIYREALFPGMASCKSIDRFVDDLGAREDDSLTKVRSWLGRNLPQYAKYLDIRLREQAGEVEGAAVQLESLLSESEIRDEAAHLRLAQLLSRSGRDMEAAAWLERYLAENGEATLTAWETWLAIASSKSSSSNDGLPSIFASVTTSDDESPMSFAGDVAWVLSTLREYGAVRINCGRGRYRDTEGQMWASDRLADGGTTDWRFAPPVKGSEDPWLYVTLREFFQSYWLTPGYRVPLPTGVYVLTLYFFETGLNPYPCRFTIEVEGKLLDPLYEPRSGGLRVAQRKTYRVEVTDGALNVILRPKNWLATLSAIEIRRLTREPGG